MVKPAAFMPFGVGRRQCLGDQLAEREMFLFFASLMHIFDLSPVSASPEHLPSLRGVSGATVRPRAFKARLSCSNVEALVDGLRKASEKKEEGQHNRIYG